MRSIVPVVVLALLAACTQERPHANADVGASDETRAPSTIATSPTPAPVAAEKPAATITAIPQRFQGTWARDAEACRQPGAVSRLTLETGRVRFHESVGPVVGVNENGDALTVVAALTGEGETREATYRFVLSDNGRTLTDADHGMVRRRCAQS